MFADNWKISLRQVRRLLVLDVFGLSSLMLPGMFSTMTGADGFFCLLFGMAGGGVMLYLMGANLKHMKEDYYAYMKETAGSLIGDIFMVFYFLYFITLCGYVLYQTAVLILSWMLPDASFLWVAALLLLLAVFGTVRGIEGRARVYEIIFWFLGIPLFAMLFLSLREVDVDRWTPIVSTGQEKIWQGSLAFWVFLLPLNSILFLKPFCRKTEKLASCARTAMASVALADGVIYLILLGVFGAKTMGVLKRPVITLMGMINIPGGFFTRQDVVMVSVWFFALFALLHTGMFQSTLILNEMFHVQGGRASLVVVAILAFFLGMGFFQNAVLEEIYDIFQICMALPGMLGILAVLLLVRWIRNAPRLERKKGGKA